MAAPPLISFADRTVLSPEEVVARLEDNMHWLMGSAGALQFQLEKGHPSTEALTGLLGVRVGQIQEMQAKIDKLKKSLAEA